MCNLTERVLEDVHADPPWRWRAYIGGGHQLGLIDSAGPTKEVALARARIRYRLRWLGAEWVGLAVPDEARNPTAGQVAINGHRYALWRHIGAAERLVHWIMLNPSTADATQDDATMRRVCEYSRGWGYGWVTVGNLYSYRATKPADLRTWITRGGEWVTRSIGESDRWVLDMARRANLVVVAWGVHGDFDRRGAAMLALLRQHKIAAHGLALTRSGAPAHPLRLRASLIPRPLADLEAR